MRPCEPDTSFQTAKSTATLKDNVNFKPWLEGLAHCLSVGVVIFSYASAMDLFVFMESRE
eukprot:scaffold46794_cov14-Prasinocladus_malaysianus.AAC.1